MKNYFILLLVICVCMVSCSTEEKGTPDIKDVVEAGAEIYGKWKPIAEWNSDGYYNDVSQSSYVEWLVINRDGTGSWDGEEFTFVFNTSELSFSFWEHNWVVFELKKDILKMGATEDGFSEGYIWFRSETF